MGWYCGKVGSVSFLCCASVLGYEGECAEFGMVLATLVGSVSNRCVIWQRFNILKNDAVASIVIITGHLGAVQRLGKGEDVCPKSKHAFSDVLVE